VTDQNFKHRGPDFDGWYRASSKAATFGFRIERGVVAESAPYGRALVIGLPMEVAFNVLELAGFKVDPLPDNPPT
jgi:hypothetical protein